MWTPPTAQFQISNEKVLYSYSTQKKTLNFNFKTHKFEQSDQQVESESCVNFIGAIGTVHLLKGTYLIVIKQSNTVGEINQIPIHIIKTVSILPIGTMEKLTPKNVLKDLNLKIKRKKLKKFI
jgi:hypothetical protein